ncbi:hypothetical protein KKH23_10150 [Patescibacteria group bacterium]|nr:hypothetical protein [Patescibacteria group bacterium]
MTDESVEMFCCICGVVCFIAHHICYDPEITIPVCGSCHRRIHDGDLGSLDPCRRFQDKFIKNETGEIIDLPPHLQRYAEIAGNTREANRVRFGSTG